MRDLPDSRALLELARELLIEEILPVLPPDRHRDLHLVATALSITLREGEDWQQQVESLIQEFYPDQAASGDGLLARLAADLRNGAFETSPSRQTAACAILWRLVAYKLREANPQFLATNGYI